MNNDRRLQVAIALTYAISVPALGYYFLGFLVAVLFAIGYLSGFLLWLMVSARPSFASIKVPYLLTLAAFLLLHKPEERFAAFFETLSDKITGVPVPALSAGLFLSLVVLPIFPWLIAPLLMKRGNELGYFFACTLFTSMGITELAHFVFPLLTDEPYGYFPGMVSVVLLAPLGWWGMWLLSRKTRRD